MGASSYIPLDRPSELERRLRLAGDALGARLHVEAQQINETDRADYQQDLQEDIRELSPQRLAGLGVTVDDYHRWRARQDNPH